MEALERFVPFANGQYDITLANASCALGLPGAEELNVGKCAAWVEDAAKRVAFDILRHSYMYGEAPEEYRHSPAYFCILSMVTVLQKELGVRYHPARIADPSFQDPYCMNPDFTDSRDLFIHGIIFGPGGTCASMPVVYVAVGRKLKYPLFLVEAKGHLFARWDDLEGKYGPRPARFNIEATSYGLRTPSDDHYSKWPAPVTERDLELGFLKSLTTREEVAYFRITRGFCLWDNGRLGEAIREFDLCCQLCPDNPRYHWHFMRMYKQYRKALLGMSTEEIQRVALFMEEDLEFLNGIARLHEELLGQGLPGLDLSEFGLVRRVKPPEGRCLPDPISPVPGVREPLRPGESAFERMMPPAVRRAFEHFEQIAKANELTRRASGRQGF